MADRRWLHFTIIPLLFHLACASLDAEKARGIAPADLKYYESSQILCKDNSKSFPKSRLNDDFCDCPDGTDEPGTSACPEGRFYCKNSGHSPQILFASRVNDGICDCCDGSDEYSAQTKCPNTCWEAGKKSREKLEKKVATFKEGSQLRAKDIERSKQLRKQEESELASLKKEEKSLKDIAQALKDMKALVVIEILAVAAVLWWLRSSHLVKGLKKLRKIFFLQVDAIENEEKKEREEKARVEALRKELKMEEKEEVEAEPVVEDTDATATATAAETEKDAEEEDRESEPVPDDVLAEELEASEDHKSEPVSGDATEYSETELETSDSVEELSKEELGRRVASRWIGEQAEANTKNGESSEEASDEYANHEDDAGRDDGHEHEHEHEEEYTEDDEDRYDHVHEDHSSDETSSDVSENNVEEGATWWKKIQQAPKALLSILGLNKVYVNMSDAEHIRKEYKQANDKLQKVESKISELETKLKQDFGKDDQYFSLYNQCLEKKQKKYVYKVCPYKQSTQEEGHMTTRLGNFEGFLDDHKVMNFANGEHCWNGPQRSLKVKFKCGLKTMLSDVEEPSRCEYVADLWTPAVCFEDRAKALQEELDALRNAASGHEEL